jgi:hypothetical protein
MSPYETPSRYHLPRTFRAAPPAVPEAQRAAESRRKLAAARTMLTSRELEMVAAFERAVGIAFAPTAKGVSR